MQLRLILSVFLATTPIASGAQAQWRLVTLHPGPYHLGDEEISSMSPLVGSCFSFELPKTTSGGSFAFKFEPYGLERAYFRFADGSRFIPAQAILTGTRPNYWGESTTLTFELPPGSSWGAICSDQIEPSDFDDFMFRNLEIWVYFAESAQAQDLSQYNMFYQEHIEGPYGNNWYLRHLRQDGAYHHFSVIAEGKLPYEGTFITACRTDMQDSFVPNPGYEYSEVGEEVIGAFYYWVCTS